MRHTIRASQVELVLIAKKGGLTARWAAMSAHTITQSCRRSSGTFRMQSPSMAGPMDRGELYRAIDRTIAKGRQECLATFGAGVRVMQNEACTYTLRA